MRMSDDFVSVRLLVVCASEQDGELLRQGATLAVTPAHFNHVATVAAARTALERGGAAIGLVALLFMRGARKARTKQGRRR